MGLSFESDRNVVVSELNEMAVSSGLVAYYTCDALNGTTLLDNSGNNNNGTNYGATITTGINNNALSFNGTSNYVLIPSYQRNNGQELTVSCWFYQNGRTGYQDLISNRTSAGLNWLLYTHANDGSIQLHGTSQNKSSAIPSLSAWHHVVATVTTNGVSLLYLDNILVQTVFDYTYGNATPTSCYIGTMYASGEYFNGLIDEVRIYNRALSEAEIKQLYKLNTPNNVASMKENQ